MAAKRSPYAKSLELKQYRHRVQQHKTTDTDNWIEEALEEYYSQQADEKFGGNKLHGQKLEESEPKAEGSQSGRATDNEDHHAGETSEVVGRQDKKGSQE